MTEAAVDYPCADATAEWLQTSIVFPPYEHKTRRNDSVGCEIDARECKPDPEGEFLHGSRGGYALPRRLLVVDCLRPRRCFIPARWFPSSSPSQNHSGRGSHGDRRNILDGLCGPGESGRGPLQRLPTPARSAIFVRQRTSEDFPCAAFLPVLFSGD